VAERNVGETFIRLDCLAKARRIIPGTGLAANPIGLKMLAKSAGFAAEQCGPSDTACKCYGLTDHTITILAREKL